MAVTSITHHYNMITNKFENLHALQRKINTRALLPDARSSRPILAVKKVTYIQALRLNTVQPIGPLAFKNSAAPVFFHPLPGVWILMKCHASRLIRQCYFYFNLSTVPSLITTKINLLQSNLRVLMNK